MAKANIAKSDYVTTDKRHDIYFDNGVWVGIMPEEQIWAYDRFDDPESYISGIYQLDRDTVVDYDGVYQLPDEVIQAFRYVGYNVHLL